MDYDSDEELQQLIRARAEKEKKGEYSQIHTYMFHFRTLWRH